MLSGKLNALNIFITKQKRIKRTEKSIQEVRKWNIRQTSIRQHKVNKYKNC